MQVCERLPLVEVTWQAPRAAGGQESGAAKDSASAGAAQRYVLEVHLRRRSGPRGAAGSRAYTPRFPKVRLCSCTCCFPDMRSSRVKASSLAEMSV